MVAKIGTIVCKVHSVVNILLIFILIDWDYWGVLKLLTVNVKSRKLASLGQSDILSKLGLVGNCPLHRVNSCRFSETTTNAFWTICLSSRLLATVLFVTVRWGARSLLAMSVENRFLVQRIDTVANEQPIEVHTLATSCGAHKSSLLICSDRALLSAIESLVVACPWSNYVIKSI